MIRRSRTLALALAVLVVLVVSVSVAWLQRPVHAVAPTAEPPPGASLVVVGLGAIAWTDVSPQETPVLWSLLRTGSTAAVSIKAMRLTTCPSEGWATLGAGEAAGSEWTGECIEPEVVSTAGGSAGGTARVEGFDAIAAASREGPHQARLGLLGESLAAGASCVQAIGPGAALAVARADGRVERWSPLAAASLADDLARCPLAVVDVGSVGTTDGKAAGLDRRVGEVLAAAPVGSDVLVVSLADRGDGPRLQALAAAGPGYPTGLLASASTRASGLAQLSDVTATILAWAGVQPLESIGGRAMTVGPSGDDSEAGARSTWTTLTDLELRSDAVHRLVAPFLVVWLSVVTLLLAGLALLWRARPRLRRTAGLVALVSGAMPAATFLATLVPWWRWGSSTPVLLMALLGVVVVIAGVIAGVTAGVIAGVTAGVGRAGPWAGPVIGRLGPLGPLGPLAAVAGLTAGVIGIDLVTGSHLQVASVFGLQPLVGGRFYGMGNVAFALYATAVLLLAACLAHALIRRNRRRAAVTTVATIGLLAVAVDVAPAWGADFGGPIAFVPALGLLLLRVAGVRPTAGRLALIGAACVAVVGLAAWLDWLRSAEQRTHLGRFVQTLLDGEAWTVVRRKLDQNVGLLLDKPLVLVIAVAAVGVLIAVLLRPGTLGTTAFAALVTEAPLLRHGLMAVMVMAAVGFVTNDSGAAIPPVAAILAVPLVVEASVRRLPPAT